MRKEIQDLWTLAEPYVRDAGFDLVEVHSGRESTGWVVRLYIDRVGTLEGSQAPRDGLARAELTLTHADRVGTPGTQVGTTDGVSPPRDGSVTVAPTVASSETAVPPTLEDCALVSRDISAALDVADLIPHAYQLEVSSPGLDRPLRRERDFARFAGRSARVRLVEGVEGRRNFSGTLRGAQGGLVEIECDGRSYQLPVEQVAKANLVPDWEREFQRSAS